MASAVGEGTRREDVWLAQAPLGVWQCVRMPCLAVCVGGGPGGSGGLGDQETVHARMGEVTGSAAVPQWQALEPQASCRCGCLHVGAFASVCTSRTETVEPWLCVLDGRHLAPGRRPLAMYEGRTLPRK